MPTYGETCGYDDTTESIEFWVGVASARDLSRGVIVSGIMESFSNSSVENKNYSPKVHVGHLSTPTTLYLQP